MTISPLPSLAALERISNALDAVEHISASGLTSWGEEELPEVLELKQVLRDEGLGEIRRVLAEYRERNPKKAEDQDLLSRMREYAGNMGMKADRLYENAILGVDLGLLEGIDETVLAILKKERDRGSFFVHEDVRPLANTALRGIYKEAFDVAATLPAKGVDPGPQLGPKAAAPPLTFFVDKGEEMVVEFSGEVKVYDRLVHGGSIKDCGDVKQELREADPDRVASVFKETLEAAAKARISATVSGPFGFGDPLPTIDPKSSTMMVGNVRLNEAKASIRASLDRPASGSRPLAAWEEAKALKEGR